MREKNWELMREKKDWELMRESIRIPGEAAQSRDEASVPVCRATSIV